MGINQHVVPTGGKWAVKGAENSKDTAIYNKQKKTIDIASKISRNQGSELFIHGRDDKIRERDSYGNDPFPPEG